MNTKIKLTPEDLNRSKFRKTHRERTLADKIAEMSYELSELCEYQNEFGHLDNRSAEIDKLIELINDAQLELNELRFIRLEKNRLLREYKEKFSRVKE